MKNIVLCPLVTVCITTYNRSRLIKNAVQSVLKQDYNNLEIVIVEDGSDSGLKDWIIEKKISQISYIRHNKNLGLSAARNTGLEKAKGKYITFLDDDDEWDSTKIKKQVYLFEKLDERYLIVYCGRKSIDQNKNASIQKPRLKGNLKKSIISHGLETIPSSSMYRSKTLLTLGGHDQDLSSGIDHDLWMKIAERGYFVDYINEPLVIDISHNEMQMTTDWISREQGINKYIDKWKPTIIEWFGEENGHKYCSDYHANAMCILGFSLIKKSKNKIGKKILWSIFIRNPWFILSRPKILLAMLTGNIGYRFSKKIYSYLNT